jgi:hypothetical protein
MKSIILGGASLSVEGKFVHNHPAKAKSGHSIGHLIAITHLWREKACRIVNLSEVALIDVGIELDLPGNLIPGNERQDRMVHSASGELNLTSLCQLTKPLNYVVKSIFGQLLCEDNIYVESDSAASCFLEDTHRRPMTLLSDLTYYLLGLCWWLVDVKKIAPVHRFCSYTAIARTTCLPAYS